MDTVRKWRGRFAARGLNGLKDLPRCGRPRRISALERAAVCALACQLPAATGVPLSRRSAPELAAELAAQGLASPISPSSVLRILAEHPIKPWRYQSWIFPRDPYSSAPRVFVIVDNGSDHRGNKAARRLGDAHPNAIMIHTPVYASWLNQAEIVFSIVQKKILSPSDFAGTAQLAAALLAFIDRYNQTARPFIWKFTAADLAGLLQRISARHEPTSLPEAA